MEPVQVVAVLDDSSNDEAVYVNGELREFDGTMYMGDLARLVNGLTIQFSQVVVNLPGDDWPLDLIEVLKHVPVESK